MKQLQHAGDPASRQRGLVAGCIAFPQNSAEVFNVLPHRAHVVAEYVSVQFTDVDFSLRRSCPALYVRRAAVAAALRWLQLHNEHYANIVLDPAALEDLPEHDIPEIFLSPADPLPGEALPQPEGVRPPTTSHACLRKNTSCHIFVVLQIIISCRLSLPGPPDAALPESVNHPLTAAILDPEDGFLRHWHETLTAVQAAVAALDTQPLDSAAAAAHTLAVAHATRALHSSATTGDAETDSSPFTVLLPHGSTPLSTYHPSFWSACFPTHFPYGLGGHATFRNTMLSDEQWARHLLLRGDRTDATAWCRDLPLIAVLYSTIHRRQLQRAIKIRLTRPTWARTVADLATLRSCDFLQVYNALSSTAALPRSMQEIPDKLRALLHDLQIIQSAVPGTDGARIAMRHQLVAMHFWFGLPVAWLP